MLLFNFILHETKHDYKDFGAKRYTCWRGVIPVPLKGWWTNNWAKKKQFCFIQIFFFISFELFDPQTNKKELLFPWNFPEYLENLFAKKKQTTNKIHSTNSHSYILFSKFLLLNLSVKLRIIHPWLFFSSLLSLFISIKLSKKKNEMF